VRAVKVEYTVKPEYVATNKAKNETKNIAHIRILSRKKF
jgi:hypothetical protein